MRADPPYPPALMSADVASRYLGICANTLRARVPVPVVRIGARVLYRRADLDAFVAGLSPDMGAADEARTCDAGFGLDR